MWANEVETSVTSNTSLFSSQAPVEQYHAAPSVDVLDIRELVSKAICLVGAQIDGREQTVAYREPDLPIVAGILESHGGHIDVDSTPGRGTELKLILPLTR